MSCFSERMNGRRCCEPRVYPGTKLPWHTKSLQKPVTGLVVGNSSSETFFKVLLLDQMTFLHYGTFVSWLALT